MPRILRSLVILMAALFCLPAFVYAAVGYTPGSFNVNDTGAATYSIPIAVPPGTAGMQPSLSLTYNSQSGNGLVGMGFSLQGLSAITRCPTIIATEGASGGVNLSNTNDRFCLDGQKLILVSGTYGAAGSEYRTELDSLTKITASGTGPQYFIANTKSGQTIEYGVTADARVLASGTTTPLVWAADKITDTAGNYLTMSYCNYGTPTYCAESYTGTPGAGEFFPARVDYAGKASATPTSSVRFIYSARTDTSIGYVGGSASSSTVRLTNVQVLDGGGAIRDYRLTYISASATNRSLLKSITECDGITQSADCLASTSVDYQPGTSGFDTVVPTANPHVGDYDKAYTLDVNGDGLQDVVSCPSNSSAATWDIQFGQAGTPFLGVTVNSTASCSGASYSQVIDYDSDGKSDLLVPHVTSNDNFWYVLRWTGNDLSQTNTIGVGNTTIPNSGYTNNPQVLDVDGDGRQDLAVAYSSYWRVRLNTGNGFGGEAITAIGSQANSYVRQIDYNGDGRMDLIGTYGTTTWRVYQSNGTGFDLIDTMASNSGNSNNFQVMDINGDGRRDLAVAYSSHWRVRLNTGSGFGAEIVTNVDDTSYGKVRQIDFNNDGRMDLIGTYGTTTWWIYQSNGSGFDLINTMVSNSGNSNNPQAADFNGDGLTDMALAYDNIWKVLPHAGAVPDLLTSITNGFGNQTVITYKPLTNSFGTIYTKGNSAAYPQQDFQGAMYVVQRYTTSDGINGSYPVDYLYSGARIDLWGRGFLGFSLMTATDTRTGISTETNYSQVWPTTGMVTSVEKAVDGATISATTNILDNISSGTTNAYYHFPYVRQSSTGNYELSGVTSSLVSTTSTTTYYKDTASYSVPDECAGPLEDSYGNPTCIVVKTTVGGYSFTKATVNAYTNDTANWFLGRLTNSKVTSTLPSNQFATRESSFTYDPTTGLLSTEVVEPNGNTGTITNLKQTTTYTYDNYGNKDSATVSGADIASRATYMDYTTPIPATATPGRFLYKTTNALGQTETHEYDARFGTMTKLTGPNGLSTQWQYDNFGRKQLETRADDTTTSWTYTLCVSGCPTYAKYYVTQTTSGAPTVTVYYDLLDREVRTQTQGYNGTAIYKDTVYDNLGQVAKVSRPYYSSEVPWWTYFSYDALGRAVSQSLPTQASVAGNPLGTTSYNGLTTTVTQYRDGTALTTTQVKDALGQLVSVTDADTKTTNYEYDPFGNLTRVIDPALNATSMSYDIRGRKLNMTDPDMGYWQYTYNSVGEMRTQTDAKGQTVEMFYDDLGRLATRNEAEGQTTWTYDYTALSGSKAIGKLSKVTWPGGDSRTYTYDDYGRPKDETTTLSGTTFTLTTAYDGYSRLDRITYPSAFAVRNNYGPYGYLESITSAATAATYWNAPMYKADGQVSAFTLGNGLSTVNQINDGTGLNEGISTGVGQSGSATQYLTYQYDTLGNLKQRVDGNQSSLTEIFGYDNLNRLTSASIAGVVTKSVSYGAIGNILSKSDIGTYSYDPLHKHAVKFAGGGTYTYDANGNQQTGPNGRSITYTSFNQPMSITANGKTDTFTYDGDHQRVTGRDANNTSTVYIHPRIDLGAHYERETKLNGVVAHKNYIYAGKETIGVYTIRSVGVTGMQYFHKDHLGSIDTITDELGGIVERLSYDAWGKRRSGNWTDATSPITSLTHHGFTGHEMLDDVGLINMNARLYDPKLGRFLQADPTVQAPGNPQTLNRYSYAANNPLTHVDPSGYSWWTKFRDKWLRPILAIAAMVFIPQMSWYFGTWANFMGGFVGGLIATGGDLKAGLIGGLTAGAFGMLHGMPQGGFGNGLSRVLAHGSVGGISSVLQGGKFKSGFMAAGFTQGVSLSHAFDGLSGATETAYRTKNAIAAAIVGGTASVIGGGKFENGAVTGAFSRLFNDLSQSGVSGNQKTGYRQQYSYGGKQYDIGLNGVCATAECVAEGANINWNDPGSQALSRAMNADGVSFAGNVATGVLLFTPVGAVAEGAVSFSRVMDFIKLGTTGDVTVLLPEVAGSYAEMAATRAGAAAATSARVGAATSLVTDKVMEQNR